MKILFFTRGKGYGHAIRDMWIASEIRKKYPESEILLYANEDAEKCYQENGQSYKHYELEEIDSSELKAIIIKGIVVKERPDFVFFDEITEGIHEITQMSIECAFITNYLTDKEIKVLNQEHTNIIFCELSDFVDRDKIHTNIHFIGPLITKKASLEGLPKEIDICVCLGGAGSKLAKLENIWLINECLQQLPNMTIMVLGQEYAAYFPDAKNVRWVERTEDYLSLAKQAKTVICRGGINTLWELADSGICPTTIPFSNRINPMEIKYSKMMEVRGLARLLTYDAIKEGTLKKVIQDESRRTSQEVAARCRYIQQRRDVSLPSVLHYLLEDILSEENTTE